MTRRALLISFAISLSWRYKVESFSVSPPSPSSRSVVSWGKDRVSSSAKRQGWCDSACALTSTTQQWQSPPQRGTEDGSLSSPLRRNHAQQRLSRSTKLAASSMSSESSDNAPTAVRWADSDDDNDNDNNNNIRDKRLITKELAQMRKLNPEKFSATSMLNHDLLTKAQEQELGRALQRALQVQGTLIQYDPQQQEQDYPQQQQQQPTRKGYSKRGRPSGVKNKKKSCNVESDEDELQRNLSILYGGTRMDLEYLEAPHEEDRWKQQHMRSIQTTYTSASDKIRNGKREVVWNMDAAMAMLDDMNNKAVKETFGDTLKRHHLEDILIQGAIARDTLIRTNIRLVMGFAQRWLQNSQLKYLVSLDEAVQEGIMGLAIAVERYDPERNLKFSTYATPWIINTIRRYFQQASVPYRLPINYHDTKRRFQLLVKSYHEAGVPVPPLPDLAREMGMRLDRLCTILNRTRATVSMDAPMHTSGTMLAGKAGSAESVDGGALLGLNLVDPLQTSAEHDIDLSLLRQSLENAMASELVPYERDIIRLRLGLDDGVHRTVPQVIEAFYGSNHSKKGDKKMRQQQLSPSQVRIAERNAYQKLRSPRSLSNYKLLAYLDFCGLDNQDREEETTVAKTSSSSLW